jgi:hypothetical protein
MYSSVLPYTYERRLGLTTQQTWLL